MVNDILQAVRDTAHVAIQEWLFDLELRVLGSEAYKQEMLRQELVRKLHALDKLGRLVGYAR